MFETWIITIMSVLYSLLKFIDKLLPVKEVYAHCDIPCGIYDPHLAQMAAHTIIRMVNLINELPKPSANATPEERQTFVNKLARYTAVKEQHAELCKHETRILWGDYFKPEHVKEYPELHELVWKVMKLGSKARQEINLETSKELLETVEKIAEIFWKTKGVKPVKVKSFYPSGLDIVYPKIE